MKLGIIGYGAVGRQQILAAANVPGLEVVAVAEDRPTEVPPGVALHRHWRELLRDETIDAVSVCLPHNLHAEVTTAALLAGKHVLVEKPLAMNPDEGRRMVDAARTAGRVLMVEMTHRFYPPVREAREFVLTGALGEIFAVEDRIVEWINPDKVAPWLFQKKVAGGGAALTDGVHMLDRIAWACGQPLRFHSGVAGFRHNLGDVEDTASMQLSLQGGAPVSLLTSFARGAGIDDELTIYGTKGTLRIWAWRGWRFEPQGGGEIVERNCYGDIEANARVRVGMGGALAEFVAAVAENRTPDPAPEDIVAAQEIIEQFYQYVGLK